VRKSESAEKIGPRDLRARNSRKTLWDMSCSPPMNLGSSPPAKLITIYCRGTAAEAEKRKDLPRAESSIGASVVCRPKASNLSKFHKNDNDL
jgi:hypothetical protein